MARRRLTSRVRRLLVCGPVALLALAASAEPALPSADEVRARWRGRLDGLHFSATVRLVIEQDGRQEVRKLTVWRDDRGSERERLMARFLEPSDLRGVALLYLEQPGRSNDYFLYQPQSERVRRIPEELARQDVYGLDLEYLGFDVAGNEATVVESLELVTLGDRSVLRYAERAAVPNSRFERRTLWIDPETYLPLRSRYEKRGRVTLSGETLEVRAVQGVPTPVRMRFLRPQAEQVVEMHVEEIDYRAPIHESFFSTLTLIK